MRGASLKRLGRTVCEGYVANKPHILPPECARMSDSQRAAWYPSWRRSLVFGVIALALLGGAAGVALVSRPWSRGAHAPIEIFAGVTYGCDALSLSREGS